MLLKRRALLTSALGAVAAAGATGYYARFVEPEDLQVRRHKVRITGLKGTVRVAHLSDLHASVCVRNELIEESFRLVRDMNPDLICVTGDFVTHHTGYDAAWYTRALRRLSDTAPTYATMGNHDGGRWSARHGSLPTSEEVRRVVADAHIQVLQNRSLLWEAGGRELQVVGLADFWAYEADPVAAFARTENTPTIVLSHNPDSKEALAPYSWQLLLSGHTHGGQVVIPGVGAPHTPVEDKRYLSGLKPWLDRMIHVSTGVGNAFGIRLNCPPEVSLLELIPA